MAEYINSSWSDLGDDAFNQSKMNFYHAIEIIDKEFGDGYAKENPQLIAAFMQSSSTELAGTIIGACLQDLQEISKAIEGVSCTLENINSMQ